MPTLLDELLILTKVDLTGLGTGLREAEEQVKRTQSRLGELGRIPLSVDTTKATTSLKEFTAQLKEAETIQERIGRQFTGSPLPAATSNIAQHQRALNAELKESEAIQARINRQFSSTPLPVASSNIAQHRQELELLRREGEAIQRSWGGQFGGGGMTMLPEGRRFGAVPQERGFNPFSPFAQQFAGAPAFGGSSMSEAEFRRSLLTPERAPSVLSQPSAFLEGIGGAVAGTATMLGHALAMGAAFAAVYGTIQLIKESFSGTIGLGLEFNKELEVSKIALGSLIGLSSQYKSESGATASVLTTYKASLSEAAAVQEKLFDLDAKTLGTGQELIQVYEKVLAFSRGQKASEDDRLKLSSGILNAAKIFGLTEEQTAIEARQILTLQSAQGQSILQNLGISMQQARSWREQGILVQELNKALEVYNLLGTEAGNSWQGLSTTLESLRGRITGTIFTETFGAAKDILSAMNDEFRTMRANGEILPAIFGGSQGEVRAFGAEIARVLVSTTSFVAEAVNKLIEWGTSLSGFFLNAKNFALSASQLMAGPGGLGGLPVTYGSQTGGEAQVYDLKTRYGQFDTTGAPFSYTSPTSDIFFNKPEQSSFSDIQARLRIGEQQLASLSATDTRGMNKTQLDAYVSSVTKAADALTPLKVGLDRVKDSLAYDVWDTNRKRVDALQNSLYGLNDALKKPVVPPPTPEKDAIANRRNAAIAAAERAESGVQKTSSSFTGDIDAYMKTQEEAIKANQAKKIAAAKGDGATIAAINREAAALTEKAWQDANKLFIDFETKKQTAAERTANTAIRSTEIQAKSDTQLLDIQISGIQRQIQFAELRKEPVARILDLYNQEVLLVQHKSDIEIKAYQAELIEVQKKIDKENEILAQYDEEIRKISLLPDSPDKAGRLEQKTGERDRVQNDLNNSLSERVKLNGEIAQSAEKAGNAEFTAASRAAQANKSFQQILQERLQGEQLREGEKWADRWEQGIDRASGALAHMLRTGKFELQSFATLAGDIFEDITKDIIKSQIKSTLYPMLGIPVPGGAAPTASGTQAPATAALASAGGGGLFNWLFGGGGMQPAATTGVGADDAAFWASVGLPGMGGAGGSSGMMAGEGMGLGGAGILGMLPTLLSLGKGKGGGVGPMIGEAVGGMLLKNMLSSKGGIFGAGGSIFGNTGAGTSGGFFGGLTALFGMGGGAAAGAGEAAAAGGGIMASLGSLLGPMMTFLPFLLHDGGIVGHHMGALSADEHLAKLQSGEMVISRGDTSSLFNGGSARVPGGYRPDSRIFMANVGSASRSGGTGATGSGGHVFVTMHVHANDANSFGEAQGEVQRKLASTVHNAHRRSN